MWTRVGVRGNAVEAVGGDLFPLFPFPFPLAFRPCLLRYPFNSLRVYGAYKARRIWRHEGKFILFVFARWDNIFRCVLACGSMGDIILGLKLFVLFWSGTVVDGFFSPFFFLSQFIKF